MTNLADDSRPDELASPRRAGNAPAQGRQRAWMRYAAVVPIIGLALLIRLVLDPVLHDRLAYASFYVAIALIAWFGPGPALFGTVLGFLAADWFFVEPRHTFFVAGLEGVLGAGSYFLITLTIAFFSYYVNRAREQALWRQRELEHEAAERRLAELEARELSQRLSYHVDHSPLAVIEWGPDMRLVRWSAEAERVFGWKAGEVLGKRMEDFRWVYAEDQAKVSQVSSDLAAGQMRSFSANRNYRKDGSVVYCEWYNSSLVDESGRLKSILSLVLDVTERKRAEEALRQAHDELELRVRQRTAELDCAAEAVRGERKRFHDVLDVLPVYVILLTPDYRVRFANRVFLERFGDSHGRRCYEYLFGRDAPCEVCDTYKVLETMAPREWEWTGPDHRDYYVFDYPFTDADGSTLILEMGVDITERKRAEAELSRYHDRLEELVKQRTRELESSNAALQAEIVERTRIEAELRRSMTEQHQAEQALQEAQARLKAHAETLEKTVARRTARLQETVAELEHFSYAITHDMRSPLRALQGFVTLIEEECGDCLHGSSREFFRRIKLACARMDQLIVDSLNWSKAARQEMTLEAVDLAPLLQGMVETYPNLLPEKANIEIRLPGLLMVLGNEAALTQCFSNLLGNAVKFAKPGAKPRIRVWAEPVPCPAAAADAHNDAAPPGASAEQAPPPPSSASGPSNSGNGRSIRIWVEDDGIGIPKGFQARVFDMFQRASIDHEGTGVGLAIVRKVVQRMGGEVGVESEEGRGSRFWVRLVGIAEQAGDQGAKG